MYTLFRSQDVLFCLQRKKERLPHVFLPWLDSSVFSFSLLLSHLLLLLYYLSSLKEEMQVRGIRLMVSWLSCQENISSLVQWKSEGKHGSFVSRGRKRNEGKEVTQTCISQGYSILFFLVFQGHRVYKKSITHFSSQSYPFDSLFLFWENLSEVNSFICLPREERLLHNSFIPPFMFGPCSHATSIIFQIHVRIFLRLFMCVFSLFSMGNSHWTWVSHCIPLFLFVFLDNSLLVRTRTRKKFLYFTCHLFEKLICKLVFLFEFWTWIAWKKSFFIGSWNPITWPVF